MPSKLAKLDASTITHASPPRPLSDWKTVSNLCRSTLKSLPDNACREKFLLRFFDFHCFETEFPFSLAMIGIHFASRFLRIDLHSPSLSIKLEGDGAAHILDSDIGCKDLVYFKLFEPPTGRGWKAPMDEEELEQLMAEEWLELQDYGDLAKYLGATGDSILRDRMARHGFLKFCGRKLIGLCLGHNLPFWKQNAVEFVVIALAKLILRESNVNISPFPTLVWNDVPPQDAYSRWKREQIAKGLTIAGTGPPISSNPDLSSSAPKVLGDFSNYRGGSLHGWNEFFGHAPGLLFVDEHPDVFSHDIPSLSLERSIVRQKTDAMLATIHLSNPDIFVIVVEGKRPTAIGTVPPDRTWKNSQTQSWLSHCWRSTIKRFTYKNAQGLDIHKYFVVVFAGDGGLLSFATGEARPRVKKLLQGSADASSACTFIGQIVSRYSGSCLATADSLLVLSRLLSSSRRSTTSKAVH